MVIFHSYVSLPEGMNYLFFGRLEPTSCPLESDVPGEVYFNQGLPSISELWQAEMLTKLLWLQKWCQQNVESYIDKASLICILHAPIGE